MAKRARILVLTDDERNHRHARRLVDTGVLPLRGPWLLGPADLESLAVSPDLVVALGPSAVLPAARLRERLGLPGPRPADVFPLLDREVMHHRARAAGLLTTRRVSAIGVRNWDFRVPLAVRSDGEVRKVTAAADLPTGEARYEAWVDADVCHVDGVVVGGRVVFAVASRYLRTRHDFATGSGMGGITLDGPEADPLLAAAAAAVSRLGVPDGAFHVELFDTRPVPVLLAVAPHPPPALQRATVQAATGVDLLAEHIRAGVGQPTFPRRTRGGVAGYWRVPPEKAPRPRPALPAVHSAVVLADLPGPDRHAPTEVVVRGDHAPVVLTDLIALRERLDESVSPRS
ncbi:hypothetical protein [Actinophytocola gossypii]|uniref:ATP-grasp domain-containing protein n=1 Tax=Actinophytocola gossypii TaxID=2812003 RepID=A0ABT2J157_9PSEU|nr:hypothetical protein [Actinophytocola gossypii]MCT2581597.1 hypothetical protein [Actinophytocola gossypii]